MATRKSSAAKAYYIVYVKGVDMPLLCKWINGEFRRYTTVSAYGEGSWRELRVIDNVVKYVRVDNLEFQEC